MEIQLHANKMTLNLVCFVSKNKVDLLILNFLAFITLYTSVFFLQNHAEFMYDIDSYRYYFLATSDSDLFHGSLSSFVGFLSLIQGISSNSDQLQFVRMINTIITVQLVLSIYLIGRKMFKPFFATVGALLVSFSPILTSYSVTLHNDIFPLAMGFTALFFMIKPRAINLVIAIILLLVAGMARPDTVLLFILPFVISISYFASKKIHVRFFYFFVLGLSFIFTSGILLSQNTSIYASRFSSIERIILFFNYNTFNTVWITASEITKNELLNNLYFGLLFVCSIIFLVNYRKKIQKFFTSKGNSFNSRNIAALYLTIIFFTGLLSAATLHIGYTINEEERSLTINDRIGERKAMPTQILILYGFTLVFSIYPASQFLYSKINEKQSFRRKNNVPEI